MQVTDNGAITHQANAYAVQFLTPQMEQFDVPGKNGSRESLGKFVSTLEKTSPAEQLHDLNTAQGRAEAIKSYKQFMRQAIDSDVVVGHNVQFDFQKISMSAHAIEGWDLDDEAVDLSRRFNGMAEQGRVINTLDLAKDYLTRQISADLTLGGEEATRKIISTMFAPETLTRASIGGAATPFSIGNIAGQTNLLELIEQKGGTVGRDLVGNLARGGSAAHQAQVDTILTNFMVQFIHTGELQYGEITGMSADVSAARKTILKSSAIVPTTNIASAQHMSDAVYNYAKGRGIEGVKLTTDNSIIAFSKENNSWYEYTTDPTTGETISTQYNGNPIQARVTAALEASKRGDESELLDIGLNYLEQSRADRMLANIGTTANVSRTTNLRSLAAGIRAGDRAVEDQLIDSLAATREILGFQEFGERPEIFSQMGLDRVMSANNMLINQGQASDYLTRLASAGIETGIDDPYLRRGFVSIASITSGIPFGEEGAQASDSLARTIVSRVAGSGVSPAELSDRVSEFNANTGRKVGEYLSEFGISFARTQTQNYVFGASGEVSRPIISTDILKQIDIDLGGGRGPVKFLSDEFLSEYGVNKFGLSAIEREEGRAVNLVFGDLAADVNSGGSVIRRDIADQLARGITDQLEFLTSADNLKDAVEQGKFANVNQARQILGMFETEGKDKVRDMIRDSLTKRGLVVGSIEGREGAGVAAIIDQVSSLQNDTDAFQRLYQFSVNKFGDAHIAFQGRMDDTTLGILEQAEADGKIAAGTLQRIQSGEMGRESYEAYEATLERAYQDSGFRRRLQRTFARKNLDKGILGTRVGRSLRDDAVRETYRKVAPKVGMGLAAVGLLSAGYYIAKKRKESDLYGETMEEQPTENSSRGNVAYSNNETISTNTPRSTRRDPLATAGVVGNLDRNKINHTRMGPQKYNNLYGG